MSLLYGLSYADSFSRSTKGVFIMHGSNSTLKTHISSLRFTLERPFLCVCWALRTAKSSTKYGDKNIYRYLYQTILKEIILYIIISFITTCISTFDDDKLTITSTLYMSCTFLFCLVIRSFTCEGYSKFRKNLNQTIVLPVLKL